MRLTAPRYWLCWLALTGSVVVGVIVLSLHEDSTLGYSDAVLSVALACPALACGLVVFWGLRASLQADARLSATELPRGFRPKWLWAATLVVSSAGAAHFSISMFGWIACIGLLCRDDPIGGPHWPRILSHVWPCLVLYGVSLAATGLTLRGRRIAAALAVLVLVLSPVALWYDVTNWRWQICAFPRGNTYFTWWWYGQPWW